MSKPNIVVVGAGVVGCSIAFHLARAGAQVRVFDKAGVCAGMSARSGALVRMHYTFTPEAELAWKSLAYFENWSALVGTGQCGFVRTGFAIVVGPNNTERLKKNVAMLKSVGVETELVVPADLKKLEPAARTDDVALAAYEPRSGYADPIATTESFADAARAHGAQFSLHSAITQLVVRSGRCCAVVDAAGASHECDSVVLVTGPWTDRLLAPVGLRIGIHAERAQIAFFERPAALRHCVYIDTISGSYFRPHGDTLTLGGLGALSPTPADPDRYKETNDPEFIGEVRTRLGARIPALHEARYSRGHAGIYDVSPDSRPVLGAIDGVPGLFVAAGFSGTGFKTSPAVGAAMSELILSGHARTVDISPFSFGRIQRGELIRSENEYSIGAGFGHTL